jgi:hypothetical protein
MPGRGRRAGQLRHQGWAALPRGRERHDAEPADRAAAGRRVVGVAADAADGGARQPLHVDLALLVNLQGGVDRDERGPGGQPARVVRVLDRVQQRTPVGPVQQPVAAGQVGGGRLPGQQAAAVEVDDAVGQHARLDPHRRPEPLQNRDAERSRPDLHPGPLRDQGGDVLGDRAVLRLRRAERERRWPVIGAGHDDQPVRRQRRAAVTPRIAGGEHAGDQGAGRHGRAQPGHLGAEAEPAPGPGDNGGHQQVRPQRPVQQRGYRGQPDRKGPDQPGLDRAPQTPAGHHGAHVGERGEVQRRVGDGRPAEQQPDAAGGPGGLAQLRRHRARAADAVAQGHERSGPDQIGQRGAGHAGVMDERVTPSG